MYPVPVYFSFGGGSYLLASFPVGLGGWGIDVCIDLCDLDAGQASIVVEDAPASIAREG